MVDKRKSEARNRKSDNSRTRSSITDGRTTGKPGLRRVPMTRDVDDVGAEMRRSTT